MKPKPTMTPSEEAAWEEHVGSGTVFKNWKGIKRALVLRRWTLEELWEQQSIFASKGLRDTAEFLLWLEAKR